MIGQKGSLLDKIKAFFIRRRNNKIKKKEQEQKELEQILKNISEKVEPSSMVVRVGYAVDKLNLKRAVLTTPKNAIQVVNRVSTKKIDVKEQAQVNEEKEYSEQKNAYETIDIMSASELYKLREKLISQKNVLPNKVGVDTKGTSLDKVEENSNVISEFIAVPEQNTIEEDNAVLEKTPKLEEALEVDTTIKNSLNNKGQNTESIDVKRLEVDVKERPSKVQTQLDNDIKPNTNQKGKDLDVVKDQSKQVKPITVNKKTTKRIKFIFNNKIKKKSVSSFKFKTKRLNNSRKEQEVSLILIRMIDRNLSELSYFKEELEYLTDKNKNAKTKEEIFEIEQRFLILKERLEKVYNDFLIYRDKNIIQDVGELSYNEELVDLITKYKLDIRDNDNIEQILKNIENDYKSSLNVIESIVCLEESKEILGDEIYKNKEDIRVRDEELEATDETLYKINFMKEELDRSISNNKDVINSIIEKVNSISPEERVRYQFNIVNNLINSALNFSFAKSMLNPRNGRLSNALGAVCMLNSIRSLGRIFSPRREVYFVASNDFENEIIEHLNDFSYINKNIDLSIEEIDKIKNEFDDKYLHLIDDIPEISETYSKINDLQDQLKDIKIEMKHQEMRLEHSRNINNQMVKKIEEN